MEDCAETCRSVWKKRAYFYDEDDRLTGYDTTGDSTPEVTFLYDKDGYLTSKTEGANVTTYDYSSRGELLKVTFPDTSRVEYVHGVGGQRLARMTYNSSGVLQASETEKYLWSGVQLLAIYNGSEVLQTRFEYAGGRNPIAMTQGANRYYLTYDQVGSLRAIYDDAGVKQGDIIYDSFGSELSNSLTGSLRVPLGVAAGIGRRHGGHGGHVSFHQLREGIEFVFQSTRHEACIFHIRCKSHVLNLLMQSTL